MLIGRWRDQVVEGFANLAIGFNNILDESDPWSHRVEDLDDELGVALRRLASRGVLSRTSNDRPCFCGVELTNSRLHR